MPQCFSPAYTFMFTQGESRNSSNRDDAWFLASLRLFWTRHPATAKSFCCAVATSAFSQVGPGSPVFLAGVCLGNYILVRKQGGLLLAATCSSSSSSSSATATNNAARSITRFISGITAITIILVSVIIIVFFLLIFTSVSRSEFCSYCVCHVRLEN